MESIVETLYRRLRQDIVECELTPGRAFSETEFGRLYNASRTPIREVCRRLEHDGLISIIPFRGYRIAPLSVAEFHDLEELQLIFEPEAAALAAERASEEEIAEARRIVEAFSAAPGTGALQLEGRMLDQPHLEQARRLLASLN